METKSYLPEYKNSLALVVGIDKYENVSQLEYARNDAKAISRLLIEKFKFTDDNITLLLDEEATRARILTSYSKFTTDFVNEDDRILVFFAGHGDTRTGKRGEVGFLIPVDGDPEDASTFIRWDELTRNADLIKAKHIFFVMDACYGGLMLKRSIKPGNMRFVKDMMQRFSRQVLTAGKPNEVVADSGGPIPNHSIFTGHLIEALNGNAAVGDGIITAANVMSYVYNKVSTDNYSQQTPHFGFFDGDGDFIFNSESLNVPDLESKKNEDEFYKIQDNMDIDWVDNGEKSIIETVKEYIPEHKHRIKLYDLIAKRLDIIINSIGDEFFPVNDSEVTNDKILDRLSRYENEVRELSMILATLSYWGDQEIGPIIDLIFDRLSENVTPKSGINPWLDMRFYPLILLTYMAGIASVASGKYDNLATIFRSKIRSTDYPTSNQPLVFALGKAILEYNRMKLFKVIPGHENYYVPLSEYLHKTVQPWIDDIFFFGKKYEAHFDRFEALLYLICADANKQIRGYFWGPLGRFAWKYWSRGSEFSELNILMEEAERSREDWYILKAGFFSSSYGQFKEIIEFGIQNVNKLGWI